MSHFSKNKVIPNQLIDIKERYKHIQPKPQLPNFAAYIEGVDLTKPIHEEVKKELYQAFLDFEVIFFPPQQITPEQHLKLAEIFGPLASGAFFERSASHPKIEVLLNNEEKEALADDWHSDITWLEQPPAGTVIQITQLPTVGGNTAWASASKAFAALSDGLREYLKGLTAVHTWEVSGWREYLENLGEDVLINALHKFKPVEHPVITKHPESDKEILFVNESFTKKIKDIGKLESREILRFLFNWIKQPEFIYIHKWQQNGIAVWDNRSTLHYALADYWPQTRVNQRVTFNTRYHKVSKIQNTLAEVANLS